MIPLNDIIDFCRAEALAGKLFPSEVSDWRWFCREYSKTFHTPLHVVMNEMDPEHVILCVLEEGLDNRRLSVRADFDKIVEELRRLEDPDYDANRLKEIEDWSEGIEEWEDHRVATGAPLPKKGKNNAPPQTPTKTQMPKEGGINLAYLSKEQEADPDNGFDE